MVSFSCEACGDVLTKGRLDKHRGQCRGASFTCLDCMVHFQGSSYKAHTSCVSEAQKYEKSLYKEKDKKPRGQNTRSNNNETAMIPRKAYVEEEGDTEMGDVAVAIVDVPPRAPSPPPADNALPPGTNVYDFLVKADDPSQSSSLAVQRSDSNLFDTQASMISNDSHFDRHGYSYGDAPVKPGLGRYDSYASLLPQAGSQIAESRDVSQQYLTPGPSKEKGDRSREEEKSDKKRKRNHLDELDTSRVRRGDSDKHGSARPNLLHSGLTGGLNRLLSRPVDELERQAGLARSPLSPMKRSKKDGVDRNGDSHGRREPRRGTAEYEEHKHRSQKDRRRASSSSEDDHRTPRDKTKAIEYSKTNGSPSNGQLVQYHNPAELFLSFINKGPESQKGMSINKALKRYHRERGASSDKEKESNDKDLWKELRLRRNERGEIVLFV